MGLFQILVFSALSGASFGFTLRVGETFGASASFVLFDLVSNSSEPSLQVLVGVISIIFSIYFIFRLAKFLREIYEHRLAGIETTILGFSGSFLVIFSTLDNIHIMIIGIGILIIGVFVAVFYKKKDHSKRA